MPQLISPEIVRRTQAALAERIRRSSVNRVSKELGLCRATVLQALAGTARNGTMLRMAMALGVLSLTPSPAAVAGTEARTDSVSP